MLLGAQASPPVALNPNEPTASLKLANGQAGTPAFPAGGLVSGVSDVRRGASTFGVGGGNLELRNRW